MPETFAVVLHPVQTDRLGTSSHSHYRFCSFQKVNQEEIGDGAYKGMYITGTCTAFDDSNVTYTIQFKEGNTTVTESWTANQVDQGAVLFRCMDARVAKDFDGDVYRGTVVIHYDADEESPVVLYGVLYEDGDYEDFEYDELLKAMGLYQRTPQAASTTQDDDDPVAPAEGEPTKRRRRAVNYSEDAHVDLDLDSDEEPPTKKRKATRKMAKNDDNDAEFAMAEDDDDVDDDDSLDTNGSEEEEEETKPKGIKKAKKKSDAATGPTKTATNPDRDHEFDTKMAKDREAYKPNNNPQKWPVDGGYVDPVGVDPTQGIVEGIIAQQVSKVGGLLQMVVDQNSRTEQREQGLLGELTYPIRLQTACSGTDAPSIALGLIKESLDKLCESKKAGDSGHSLSYSHEMSCEIEPFKQAYIGRNFPGVTLFPDITKLTASQEVLDVYGRPQTIPYGNLFIAGTSCKDFSMLKTSYRLDIEDKGTSGETFLAAVEFLEQKKPPVAIFENVDGAPWDKMQEYITGRVTLVNRNTTKAIKDPKKKAGTY